MAKKRKVAKARKGKVKSVKKTARKPARKTAKRKTVKRAAAKKPARKAAPKAAQAAAAQGEIPKHRRAPRARDRPQCSSTLTDAERLHTRDRRQRPSRSSNRPVGVTSLTLQVTHS